MYFIFQFVEDNARLQVKTQSTATSPIGSNSSYIGLDMNNPTHQCKLIIQNYYFLQLSLIKTNL